VTASKVLQQFQFVPDSQKAVADQLGELRSRAREVAARMEQSPSIQDSYFTNSPIASGFQVAGDMALQDYHDIFSCELVLGCFWQDSRRTALPFTKD